MSNYPVYEVIDMKRKQIIVYVNANLFYVCTADSVGRNRGDAYWQIMKVSNSNSGNFPYEQVVVFAEGNDGHIFKQTDYATLTYPDN